MKTFLLPPRTDSRSLLKILIFFNVFLALYFIFALGSSRVESINPAPCIVQRGSDANSQPQILIESRQLSPVILPSNPSPVAVLSPSASAPDPEDNNSDLTALLNEHLETKAPLPQVSSPRIPWWSPEVRGAYTILNNYLPGEGVIQNDSVTYSTQATFEFFRHSETLCKRWAGPVSLAVYAPGDDFPLVLEMIHFYRRCRHPCIKEQITWHMVYDSNHAPSEIPFPDAPASPYVSSKLGCSTSDDELLTIFTSTFREDNKLPYPINVVRNVARINSRTHFILASDIELYPSINIIPMFQQMMQREKQGLSPLVKLNVPHVYHLPIFEVNANISPPLTKNDLMKLVAKGDAIFFHKWVCDVCQNFPDRMEWLKQPGNGSLNIFRSTKRTHARSSWEPLYIGTNAEPLYDERLTWDGKRDKMSQMFEMCLMNYDVLVLDNAFLVHAPGIKHIDSSDQKKRSPFIKRNNLVYNTILAKMLKKYGNRNKC